MLILLTALLAQPQFEARLSAPAAAQAPSIVYVVSETTIMRAEPDGQSPAVTKLKPFELVTGRDIVNGWLRVEATTGSETGWISITTRNIVQGSLESLRGRMFRVQQTNWPARVKLDVALGRIREGFTANQVQLALGDPRKKNLRRSADDVAEEWTYDDVRVLFSHTGVSAIEALQIPTTR